MACRGLKSNLVPLLGIDSLLIVPVFNEERRFSRAAWKLFAESASFDILFVNDGSTDGSERILNQVAAELLNVSVCSIQENRGKATAITIGLQYAVDNGYRWAGIADSDLSVGLDDLTTGLSLIRSNESLWVVSGARIRLMGWVDTARNPVRQWIGRIMATLIAVVSDVSLYDPQSPCKWFKVDRKLSLAISAGVHTRWFGEIELIKRLTLVAKSEVGGNQGVYEFPLSSWTDVKGGHLRLSSSFRVVVDLIHLIRSVRLSNQQKST